jgi:hypothetical protein
MLMLAMVSSFRARHRHGVVDDPHDSSMDEERQHPDRDEWYS